ncbi:LysR substrate-binding domain-containing protein [Sulfitobacter sp. THAF37]|uniref:LysR family transcriptional regulator n=1 Tax=Sulfitobacter sp. THAF37 TaxID=2587855 RepID=UPI001561B268|nr:LysR substrate-binding domain-containing protein [Sulfitobacter sp. THAF37]
MHNVNLNALRVFATAARAGSFQRAAATLNISHGAVSQRVKQLETDLGVTLFHRKPRGVTLTDKGRTYFETVDKALNQVTQATAELRKPDRQITLHIGPSSALKWLMPRMEAFNAKHPEISLRTEIHQVPLTRDLGGQEIALWPAQRALPNAAHHLRCLSELEMVAVCSPEVRRRVHPAELHAILSCTLLQDDHRRWERLIEESGHEGPHNILNFGSAALALDAAMQGHGIAIAPYHMTAADLADGKLVSVWHPATPSGEFLYLAWSRRHARDRPLRRTVEWILGEFGIEHASAPDQSRPIAPAPPSNKAEPDRGLR